MKKRIIITAVFAICLALCAAVWPQAEPAEETPAVPSLPVVTATKSEVPEVPEIEEIILPEEEKADTVEPGQAEEISPCPRANTYSGTSLHHVKYRLSLNSMPRHRKNRNLLQHYLTRLQKIWSMWRASVGWKAKAPTSSNTPMICTRTAIKSEAWDK